jgi:uncharacterized membrane protein YbaN (DUF454 family)
MIKQKHFKFIVLCTIVLSLALFNFSVKNPTFSNLAQAQSSPSSTISAGVKPSESISPKSGTTAVSPAPTPINGQPPVGSAWVEMPSQVCLPEKNIISEDKPILAKIDAIVVNQNTAFVQLWCHGNSRKQLDSILINNPSSTAFLQQFKEGDQISLKYRQKEKEIVLSNMSIDFKQINGWSIAIYIGSMIAFYFLIHILTRKGKSLSGLRGLMIGEDGRYSNSRTQIALWFFVLISTYIAVTVARVWYGGIDFAGGIAIPYNLLFLSGISAVTFATAKQITKSSTSFLDYFNAANLGEVQEALAKKDPGELKNTENIADFKNLKDQNTISSSGSTSQKVKPSFFHDLFYRDGSDSLDLGDFQMSIMTFLTIAIYVGQVLGYLGIVSLHKNVALPDVDSTLLATFGIGQAAYLAKKYVDDTGKSP